MAGTLSVDNYPKSDWNNVRLFSLSNSLIRSLSYSKTTNQSQGFKLKHCFPAHLSLPQQRLRMTNLPVNPSFHHLQNHFFDSITIYREETCVSSLTAEH